MVKFEVGKTYKGYVYNVDGKQVEATCIKRTKHFITMQTNSREYISKFLTNDKTERLMSATCYFSADGNL